jgi:transcriptional regulator with XRE-family HTH domain
MSKIIADNDFILDAFNPAAIAKGIAERMRERRLELNLTQQGLAVKAGVSLGSLKRFENSCEISLKHLLMLAVVLDATEEFDALFSKRHYQSIEEALKMTALKKRKRGKRNG